ncbi:MULTISPECIES: hypothetical protein [Megasphaera]|uniref:Uncharacterized protein n=1 Tax=Megasphaera elsdenii TaxID=907 RepID=A0A2S0M473_MEGEL|nr:MULTISPECIES: hypothetical protein [Megasphaera]AVO26264.1 hypothetical protein C6Y28_00695 [Megasphaera elsdenii]MCI7048816.1 hypothetical protein [Megasphaera elsdenii]MDY4727608.1 hypothetical protein [Megasphaera elsdenii]
MNSEDPKILSNHERDSFRGQTIDEDGTVHDQKSLYEERLRQEQEARRQHSGIHIVTSGLSWRVKLALGFIVFCIVAVIIGALGFIIMAMPYLLGIFVIYCIYSIVSSLLHR